MPNFGGFHRTLQRVRLANRGRLLLRTPGLVPFGTCICSNVETILSRTCHVYGPFEFRTSLGNSILLHCDFWPTFEYFNINHNSFVSGGRVFIFGIRVLYDKAFPMIPSIFNMQPWPWPLTYFWKTLTLAITVILGYRTFIFGMCVPYDKTFPTVPLNFNMWHNFQHVTVKLIFMYLIVYLVTYIPSKTWGSAVAIDLNDITCILLYI